jgi:GYF domain 2
MSDVAPPEAQHWHLSREGQQYGPMSHQKLLEMVEHGQLQADDLLWRPGYDAWRPASDIPGLLKPPPIDGTAVGQSPARGNDDGVISTSMPLTWERAEQLLPGMTAEINAFLESQFTRAREEALRVLCDLWDKAIHSYKKGKTSPLAQAQRAHDGLIEYAQNKLREQMLSKARSAMRSRLASTQDTELIVAMHILIDNCVDRFTCDLIKDGPASVILQDRAVREADRLWRLEHPQRAQELPVFNDQIISLFSDYARAVLVTALFAADEEAIANMDSTLNKAQYEAGKKLLDTTWDDVMEKRMPLEDWEKFFKEPAAKLTGTLVRYELAAWATERLKC